MWMKYVRTVVVSVALVLVAMFAVVARIQPVQALVPVPEINITEGGGSTLGDLDLNGLINETNSANATALPALGTESQALDSTPLPINVADPKLPENESVTPLDTTMFA